MNAQTSDLVRVQAQPMDVSTRQPTPAEILSAAVANGITPDTAAVVERITALMERQEDRAAEREFNADFAAMQAEMPEVVASSQVVINGKLAFRYAKIEDISRQAKPYMVRHGFSISFTTENPTPDRVTATCTLAHRGGHSRQSKCTVRVSSSPMGDADLKAATKAQREALVDALGIMTRPGDPEDAAIIGNGQTITPKQAMELEARADACGMSKPALLDFAGKVKTFAEIPAAKMEGVDWMIARKERQAAK